MLTPNDTWRRFQLLGSGIGHPRRGQEELAAGLAVLSHERGPIIGPPKVAGLGGVLGEALDHRPLAAARQDVIQELLCRSIAHRSLKLQNGRRHEPRHDWSPLAQRIRQGHVGRQHRRILLDRRSGLRQTGR